MATVTLSQAFDVISPISYTSSSLYGYSSSSVTYKYSKYDYSSSGGFIELTSYETFYGSFSFPSGGGVNGSITAYEIRNNYGTVLTADFNLDASIAYSYIKTGATTGLLKSRAKIFKLRLISLTSSWRFSEPELPPISCK